MHKIKIFFIFPHLILLMLFGTKKQPDFQIVEGDNVKKIRTIDGEILIKKIIGQNPDGSLIVEDVNNNIITVKPE